MTEFYPVGIKIVNLFRNYLIQLLDNCETYDSKIVVVRNRQIVSRALGSRRCLDAVFWRLMHRCERQCSESVPCADCLFCSTGTFENRVSQLPTCHIYFLNSNTSMRKNQTQNAAKYSKMRQMLKRLNFQFKSATIRLGIIR